MKIFKIPQAKLEGRRDDRGKGRRDEGGCLGSILKIGPDGRAAPEAMCHDILQ